MSAIFFSFIFISLILIFFLLFNLSLILQLFSFFISTHYGAPFVPIPKNLVRHSFKLAKVGSKDTVYDLGSGDGRVLQIAVKEFGVKKAVGFEIAPWPYLVSGFWFVVCGFLEPKIKNRITVKWLDFFKADLSKVTVIFAYLSPKSMEQLRKKFEQEAKPGTRIISARFPIPNWKEKIFDTTQKYPIWIYKI